MVAKPGGVSPETEFPCGQTIARLELGINKPCVYLRLTPLGRSPLFLNGPLTRANANRMRG